MLYAIIATDGTPLESGFPTRTAAEQFAADEVGVPFAIIEEKGAAAKLLADYDAEAKNYIFGKAVRDMELHLIRRRLAKLINMQSGVNK